MFVIITKLNKSLTHTQKIILLKKNVNGKHFKNKLQK